MQECGGFYLICSDNASATKVAEAAKTCISNQTLQDYYWQEYMQISDCIVEVDESISIGWEDYEGLFEKICHFVEEEIPGAIISGESNYCNTSGGFSVCIKASRTKKGLKITSNY